MKVGVGRAMFNRSERLGRDRSFVVAIGVSVERAGSQFGAVLEHVPQYRFSGVEFCPYYRLKQASRLASLSVFASEMVYTEKIIEVAHIR